MNAMIVPLGALVVFSCLLSTILILLHHFNLNRVPIQNKIINIIWLVPITGVSSYAVICGIKYNIYLEFIRDTYQAYCCYLFFALLLAYLGCHDDEDLFAIETYLETSSVSQLPFPLTILFSEPNLKGRKFLRFIQSGVLQFCVVKSFLVCISLLMQLFGYFHEYNFDPRYGQKTQPMRNSINITPNEYKDYISNLGFFLDWMRTFINEVYFKYGLIFPFNPDEIITTLSFTENQMHILLDIEDNAD
jgi:hypothetical protein